MRRLIAVTLALVVLLLSACWWPDEVGIGDEWDPRDDHYTSATRLGEPTETIETHGTHTLDAEDAEDWFCLDLSVGEEYTIRSIDTDGVLRGEIYRVDDGLATLLTASVGTSCSPSFAFAFTASASDRYYLRVTSTSAGDNAAYAVEYSLIPPLALDEWDPTDDQPKGAISLAPPARDLEDHGVHTLRFGDPEDWYVIYLRPGIAFECWTELTRGDSLLELYTDPSGAPLAMDDDGGYAYGSRIALLPPNEGWYYISVRAYRGVSTAYTLYWRSFTPSAATDPWDPTDDEATRATQLATPVNVPALHGPHKLSDVDREDWFGVYLVAGTRYYFEAFSGSGDTWGELYWGDGATLDYITWNDDGGGQLRFRIEYTATQSGRYKLRVSLFSRASEYSLRYGRI